MSSHSGSSGPNTNNNHHPPSRHLWIGNLSHSIQEHELTNHFLQFGELETVAFQPGRSYAFLNFKRDDDAFAAINELQGFSIAGNPIRIEFTKAVSPAPTSCLVLSVTFLDLLFFSRIIVYLSMYTLLQCHYTTFQARECLIITHLCCII